MAAGGRKPCRSMNQVMLWTSRKASSAWRSSSTVSKVRTHKRFSFKVRMKRSAQPLPSGARTKAGELSMPRKRSSFRKASDMYCEPWSCRTARPAAMSLAKSPKWRRTPRAQRLEGLEAGGAERGVEADALGRAVVEGDEHRRLALAG